MKNNLKVCMVCPQPKDPKWHYIECLTAELKKSCNLLLLDIGKIKLSLFDNMQFVVLAMKAIIKMRKFKPQIIHVQFTTALYPKFPFLIFLFLLKVGKLPIIITQHEVIPEIRRIKIRTLYEHMVYSKANWIIVHSLEAREILLSITDRKKIISMPHGIKKINIKDKNESKRNLNLNRFEKILFSFGYILPHKGIEYVIKAMPIILREKPKTLLLIAGAYWDSKYLNRLMTLAEHEKVTSNIIVRKQLPERHLELYFQAVDVIVLPYLKITQSGVLHLAIGSQKPVVVSEIGGMKEILSNYKVGIQVPPKNYQLIAEAVLKLLTDSKIYTKCVKNEQVLSEKLSWKNIAKTHVDLYKIAAKN